MTSAYRERERAALRDLALSVYADRKASPADRAAARERLICERDDAAVNVKRLTLDEIRATRDALALLMRAQRKARGENVVVIEPAEPAPVVQPEPVATLATEPQQAAAPAPIVGSVLSVPPAMTMCAPQPYTLASLGLGR